VSGFQSPYYVGGNAAGWVLTDFVDSRPQTSSPATGGTCQIAFEQLPNDQRWLVDHAAVSCTSTTPTRLTWYDSTASPSYMLDFTDEGNLDVGEWANGLHVAPGRSLLAVWTGCSAGAVATVNLQARVLVRS
jgi:hypothetical protein